MRATIAACLVSLALAVGMADGPVSVRAFGATGDGTTNDTASIQAALNAQAAVYLPTGTYLVTGLSVQVNNAAISGDGPGSVLLLAPGVSGTLLDAGGHNLSLHDVTLSGGNDVSHTTMVDPARVRNGLKVGAATASVVHAVSLHGFDEAGIWTVDTSVSRQTTLAVSDSTIYDCWDALLVNAASEYLHVANLDVHHNRYGLDIEAGNFSGVNVKLNDNGYGLYLYGGSNTNNGHGNLTGSQITHSLVYSVDAVGITIGFNLVGNQIHDGDISLSNSRGIQITNGTLDVNHVFLDGGGVNVIRGNFLYGAYLNLFVHNYLGHPDATIVVDNF